MKPLGLLDAFEEILSGFARDGFIPYLIEPSLARLVGFVDGYFVARDHTGFQDIEADQFFLWLRDEMNEFPGEGWDQKFMRDTGSEREAVRKLLVLARTFRQSTGK